MRCRSPGAPHRQRGHCPSLLLMHCPKLVVFWFRHLPQTLPHAASLTGETGGCCLGQPRHYKQNELHGHQACPEGSLQPGHPRSCSNSALLPGSPRRGSPTFVPTEQGAKSWGLA